MTERLQKMILGNAAWGFRETPLEKQLEITSSMGLKLLELSVAGHPNDRLQLNSSPLQIAAVKRLFQEYGVKLCCFSTGNDFTLKNKSDCIVQLENVKRVVDICNKLGGGYLRIFAGFTPLEEVVGERWQTMIECLIETAEYSKDKNVLPVIETHGGVKVFDNGVEHFFSTSSEPECLCQMLNELPDSIKVNFDPANIYAVGIKHPEEFFLRIKDRVAYMHLKDFVRIPGTNRFRPAVCGESDMDWRALMNVAGKYEWPALIEYENVEDVESGCRKSLEFLKGF
jgi:sugar phosphate isomerase/epimerase